MAENQLNQHESKISSIEKDISQIVGLFHKLDATIDKLSDVSASIKQMIAIHEVRFTQQEKTNEQTKIDIKEMGNELDKVKTRVSALENWRWWGAGIVTVVAMGISWALSALKFLH